MKKSMACVSAAVSLTLLGGLGAASAAPAGTSGSHSSATAKVMAVDAPPVTRALAKRMRCKYPEETSLAGGGANSGVKCRVLSSRGRQTFYVMKYRDTTRAIDFWRDWTEAYDEEDEPGYIARKGQILIIPMGGGSGEDDPSYTKKWASYAVDKLDGRLVPGYPA